MIKNEKGLTLLEVLASIVILTIILTSFYGLFIQSAKFTKINEDELYASNLANQAREYLISNPIKESLDLVTLETTVNNKFIADGYSQFTLKLTDQTNKDVIDEAGIGLFRVKIEILDSSSKQPLSTTYCYVQKGEEETTP